MSFFPHYAMMIDNYAPHYTTYNELNLKKNELIEVIDEHPNNGWSQAKRTLNDQVGIVPTAFFKYVKVRQNPVSIKDHQYELYYRNFTFTCAICNAKIMAPDEKWHCLDYGASYEEHNVCVGCFEKQPMSYWIDYIRKLSSVTLVDDPIFTKMRRHPGETLWLVSGNCVAETLNNAFLCYASRPCLAHRKSIGFDPVTKLPIVEPKYTWFTFKQIHDRSLSFGAGLHQIVKVVHRNMGESESKRGFVGVCAVNRVDWFVTDFALQLKGMVTIPLPKSKFDNEDLVDMAYVMNNAEITAVVCSREYTAQCLKLVSDPTSKDTYVPSLKVIVQMDKLDTSLETDVKNATYARTLGVKLFSMSDVEDMGSKQPDWRDYNKEMAESELVTIVYTSGSTGRSKGAIITNKNFNNQITKPYFAFHPLVSLSFCPLSHMSDRANVWNTLVNGGRSGMFSGDMGLIFDDFQALQPTVLSSTPRLYNSIFAEYQKTKVLMKTSGTEVNEDELMEKFSSILGGRMKAMTTGGAATSQEVINFLRKCFKCSVYNGYASTEIGAISWIDVGSGDNAPQKMLFEGVEVKLVDVPDLDYYSTDKPHPRGEICVKSANAIPGYYRDEEKTRELIDSEGWYHSGDIGAMDENGKITIIDRLKNIFKLSQGEFVTPEPLENTYLSSEFIDQIFIYGDSMKTFLVAVIVPNAGVILKYALDNGIQGSIEELCTRDSPIYKTMLADIARIGKEAKVAGYEIPKGFIFEFDKFTVDNGKLTGPQKTCRPYLSKFYKKQLDELYEHLENMTHADDLIASITDALGLNENPNGDSSLTEVGGDSISAARISAILEKKLNIRVSVKDLLQNKSISDIAEMIASGKNTERKPINLEEEVTLDPSIQPDASILSTVKPPELIEDILLTGATGFLGGVLLEELLKQAHVPNCRIHCIVRADSDRNAMERILKNLKDMKIHVTDEQLLRIFAYKGDLSKPKLGLSETTWNQLSECIDTVYHNGAHVNFLLSYRELYDTNVASGVELLKLCISGNKLKPLHFVSTIGVLGGPSRVIHENEPLETATPDAKFQQLGGYSQSKYVAEKIFEIARQRNIPVSIFRPELIFGHSETGYSNAVEWISRFITGIVQLGVAPISSARVHMVTVDFVARAIVALTNRSQAKLAETLTKHKVFHIVNTNESEEGSSLSVDDIVRYVQSCGYKVQQVEYSQWLQLLQKELKDNASSQNPLFAIASMFGPYGFPDSSKMDLCDYSNLTNGLKDCDVKCPFINDEQMVTHILRELIQQSS